MAITEDKLEEFGITKEIADKIDGFYQTEVIPTYKKEWDGKANTDAEGILTGASNYVKDKFGVEIEREKGEKFADYLTRVSDTVVEGKLGEKQRELEEKLKNFKGSDVLKEKYEKELADEKAKNDNILQKLAKLEPLEGLDEKYKQATEELSGLKLSVAFNGVKPSFPETVNKYEAKAKWDEFQKDVLSSNTIELVDNIPYAIDKENPHKKVKLSDLVESNKNIKELLQGRQQAGNGANQSDFQKVEGVPFEVPKNATSNEKSVIIRKHLEKTLGSKFHKDYTSQFKELLNKVSAV